MIVNFIPVRTLHNSLEYMNKIIVSGKPRQLYETLKYDRRKV